MKVNELLELKEPKRKDDANENKQEWRIKGKQSEQGG